MTILVTGAFRLNDEYRSVLESSGHRIVFMQYEKDDIPVPYEQIEGVICNGLFLHHPIEKFTSLRFIQLTSAGYDRVPMSYITDHDIEIYNARGVYSIPMAEFVVSSVLGVYKQWDHFRDSQREHSWNKHRGLRELSGKTVCIVGCGNVGTECAKRFSAFGCKITGVDIAVREDSFYDVIDPISRLDKALSRADIVVLTLPLTEDTRGLIGEKEFDILPDGCVLVNISRGAVINTEDMIRAIKCKDITVILDVFDEEPLREENPLWDACNVIITPHNSFVGEGNDDRLWNLILRNLGIVSL